LRERRFFRRTTTRPDDGDDDLADLDDGVPVVGDPVADLLPPLAVRDARVGGLLDLPLRGPGRLLTHLARVLGHLLRRVQRAPGGIHVTLGGLLGLLGGGGVASGGADLVRVGLGDVLVLGAAAVVLVLVGLLARLLHPGIG
jgi:hypothetical protein